MHAPLDENANRMVFVGIRRRVFAAWKTEHSRRVSCVERVIPDIGIGGFSERIIRGPQNRPDARSYR